MMDQNMLYWTVTNIRSYITSPILFIRYSILCGINHLHVDNKAFVCCLCH